MLKPVNDAWKSSGQLYLWPKFANSSQHLSDAGLRMLKFLGRVRCGLSESDR